MWEDLPRKNNPAKGLVIGIIILTLIVFCYIGYSLWKSPDDSASTPSTFLPSPQASLKSSPSPKLSSSPELSPTPSPASSGAQIDYRVPQDETYVISSNADTNGDKKDETLVITKKTTGKYHLYILSAEGKSLYDNQEILQKPVRIATQIYEPTQETYLSWMLVFTEQSGNLVFVHWNGKTYEIPQTAGI